VVPPVLQPWTSCAKRKSQHGKASSYIWVWVVKYISTYALALEAPVTSQYMMPGLSSSTRL
jgi:hypothetical protein